MNKQQIIDITEEIFSLGIDINLDQIEYDMAIAAKELNNGNITALVKFAIYSALLEEITK